MIQIRAKKPYIISKFLKKRRNSKSGINQQNLDKQSEIYKNWQSLKWIKRSCNNGKNNFF